MGRKKNSWSYPLIIGIDIFDIDFLKILSVAFLYSFLVFILIMLPVGYFVSYLGFSLLQMIITAIITAVLIIIITIIFIIKLVKWIKIRNDSKMNHN